jgi:hypothetical protein
MFFVNGIGDLFGRSLGGRKETAAVDSHKDGNRNPIGRNTPQETRREMEDSMRSKRVVRLAAAFTVLALVGGAFYATGFADMTVTQEIVITVGEKKSTSTQTTYWTKSKMRLSDPAGRIIITDLDKKTMMILDPKAKGYLEQTFDEMKEQFAAMKDRLEEMKLSVTETGEKKTIDGKPCEKYIFTIGPTETSVWMTKKIEVDPAVTGFNDAFLEATKDIRVLNIQGQMRDAIKKYKAYPYLTTIEVELPFAGETQRTESKVKKVSYEKIDPSVFTIPAGYSKIGAAN